MSLLARSKLIHWIVAVLFAAIFFGSAFSTLANLDRVSPAGASAGVTIFNTDSRDDATLVVDTITRFANHHQINIFKTTPSVENAVRGTDYYAFVGDRESLVGDLENGTFPTFTSSFPAAIYPASELNNDTIRGTYHIFGDRENAALLANELESLGAFVTTYQAPLEAAQWAFFMIGSPWLFSYLVSLLALFGTASYFLSSRLSIVSIRRSMGAAPLAWKKAELASILLPAVVPSVGAILVLAVYSVVFRDSYRLSTIGTFGAVHVGAAVAVCLLAFVVIWLFTSRQSIGQVLKGKRPTAAVVVASALVMAIASGATAVSFLAWSNAREAEHSAQAAYMYFDTGDELFIPAQGHVIATDEATEVFQGLGDVYLEMAAASTVVMSTLLDVNSYLDPSEPEGAFDPNAALVVNPAFVSSLGPTAQLPLNAVAQAQEPGHIVVLVPKSRAQESETVISVLREWAYTQNSLSNPGFDAQQLEITRLDIPDLGIIPNVDYSENVTALDVDNPLLIVIGDGNGVLPTNFYGDIGAFTDPAQYMARADEKSVGHAVVSMVSLRDAVALEKSNRKADLTIIMLGAIALLIVLVVATLIVSSIYRSSNAPVIFLRTITGSRFANIHAKYFGVVAALVFTATLLAVLLAGFGAFAAIVSAFVVTLGATTTAALIVATSTRKTNKQALETT